MSYALLQILFTTESIFCQKGKKIYNVLSELNVSSLKFEEETEDKLYFIFWINEKNDSKLINKYIT